MFFLFLPNIIPIPQSQPSEFLTCFLVFGLDFKSTSSVNYKPLWAQEPYGMLKIIPILIWVRLHRCLHMLKKTSWNTIKLAYKIVCILYLNYKKNHDSLLKPWVLIFAWENILLHIIVLLEHSFEGTQPPLAFPGCTHLGYSFSSIWKLTYVHSVRELLPTSSD